MPDRAGVLVRGLVRDRGSRGRGILPVERERGIRDKVK